MSTSKLPNDGIVLIFCDSCSFFSYSLQCMMISKKPDTLNIVLICINFAYYPKKVSGYESSETIVYFIDFLYRARK